MRRAARFPLHAEIHREEIPPGPVYVWDIDKTYLDTRFSQVRDLLSIPLEWGIDKRAVRGAAPLLRALRGGPSGRGHHPLFFISASPPQIQAAIARKMLNDGVEYDGLYFKDQLAVLKQGWLRQIRRHLTYKLTALFDLLSRLPEGARLSLFGDDVEDDPVIYSLFADAAEGYLRGLRLEQRLITLGAPKRWARGLAESLDEAPPRVVERVVIRLARDPSGGRIRALHRKVWGWSEPRALADALASAGAIRAEDAAAIEARSHEPLYYGSLDGPCWLPSNDCALEGC
ncbi:hypothetical protein KJ940_00635 [Myxococcota bacterium]|nr:hypothetical protein [Myxococcota bacterium]